MLSRVIDFVDSARRVAEDLHFPDAMATEQLDAVPVSNFDALAGAGLYGVSGGARAAASELAARAALTLVAATGSSAILRDRHPQRLAREALFLLVFGSRPAIKAALVPRLAAPPSA